MCGGTILEIDPILTSSAVYPHVCGGTSSRSGMPAIRRGLSPRVRGNLVHLIDETACVGSIPTCAGEPLTLHSPYQPSTVYPHVCGGTLPLLPAGGPLPGLSPRVRGNLAAVASRRAIARSIPTCAGEPSLSDSSSRLCQVYPHVCGGTCLL